MKHVELGDVVLYRGQLMEVFTIAEGRHVELLEVEGKEDGKPAECPRCGQRRSVHVLEHSPLFQDNVEPVPTVRTA